MMHFSLAIADLLDRLAFDVVQLPPLRERLLISGNVDGRTLCHPDVSGNQAASVPGVYGARHEEKHC